MRQERGKYEYLQENDLGGSLWLKGGHLPGSGEDESIFFDGPDRAAAGLV